MGQQQLLLIVLSVIIVGIAVVVGINMFGASAVAANQDAVVNDCLNIAAKAHQWAIKPAGMGGGGNSFSSIDVSDLGMPLKSATEIETENGTYTIDGSAGTSCAVTGTGVTQDRDGKVCVIETKVELKGGKITTTVKDRK
ncbi:MAG TPA: hypothetical protein ENN22_08315 [bacterium]|nr:hypothetical protein [bacterium]